MQTEGAAIELDESTQTETQLAAREGKGGTEKPAARLKKVIKVLCITAACLLALCLLTVCFLALLFVVHGVWVLSGPNRWEFYAEKNRVKAYTMKAPGSELILAAAIFRARATLAVA